MSRLAEDSGRLFEAGFQLGVGRALGAWPTAPAGLADHRQERANYDIPAVLAEFSKNMPGSAHRETLRLLGRYYLVLGHLGGYHLLQEYQAHLLRPYVGRARRRDRAQQALTVRYWQGSLTGKNHLDPEPPALRAQRQTQWLAQLGLSSQQVEAGDHASGGWLNADLLLLVQDPYAPEEAPAYSLLVVDVSLFAESAALLRADLTAGSAFLDLLERDLWYMAEKGAFTRLGITTGERVGDLFTPGLGRYFHAFAHDDKESAKVIQAAAYAHSFRQFALRAGVVPPGARIRHHIVGYTNRGINTMVVEPDQIALLAVCAAIYQEGRAMADGGIHLRDEARRTLLQIIGRNAAPLFHEGRQFVQQIRTDLPGRVIFRETLVAGIDYQNSAAPPPPEIFARYDLQPEELEQVGRGAPQSLRAAHAVLVRRALASGRRYVFLTGNPGIGKTTAIAQYLQEECAEHGYLLLYASPRKVVNQDIFAKFATGTVGGRPQYPANFLGLTTNANLIADANGQPAVAYVGGRTLPADMRGVRFLDEAGLGQARQRNYRGGPQAVAEDTIRDTGQQHAGVLQSICKAIAAVLDPRRPNAIVATVALQALKRNEQGRDTLIHLRTIFAGADQEKRGQFIPDKMQDLARTTRRLIVMLDEVTGDPSGYEFFRRVAEMLDGWELEQFGFQVTLVVADASILGREVIHAHLGGLVPEPDARKIYLTLAEAREIEAAVTDPVALVPFTFRAGDDAYLVNSNSFPAGQLHLHYTIHAPVQEPPPDPTPTERRRILGAWELAQEVDTAIADDLSAFLRARPAGGEQAIVYIQNKRRLEAVVRRVTQALRQAGLDFVENSDYLLVHADISARDRRTLADEEARNRFAVFFVTSSASRGLTFPQVRHIFVDVPRFQVETNLMEIGQVIYRGRGGSGDWTDKTIHFYLSDTMLVGAVGREWRIREGQLNVLTMLALLKLCILTRIRGGGTLRGRAVSLIPIGGKSVAAGNTAYHHDLATLGRALGREMRGQRAHDPDLRRLAQVVTALTREAQLVLPPSAGSYLQLYEQSSPETIEAWLLQEDPLPPAYPLGGLLLVEVEHGLVEANHHLPWDAAVQLAVAPATRGAIGRILEREEQYPDAIRHGVKKLAQLRDTLLAATRSQTLEHHAAAPDSYYAVPVAMLVAREPLAAFCRQLAAEEDAEVGGVFKEVLLAYVREHYPLDSVLPIGWRYSSFPFLLFSSQDLRALRAKLFGTGHTFMSPELNVLTMLLAEE